MANYLQNLTADEKTNFSLWKITRKLNSPINYCNGAWTNNNIQKAEALPVFYNQT